MRRDIDAKEINQGITLKVKIHRMRRAIWRQWIGLSLIRLASWIMWVNVELEDENEDDPNTVRLHFRDPPHRREWPS